VAIPTTYWRIPDQPPPGFPSQRPVSLALGVFDGVHRGHQELITRVVADAETLPNGIPAVLTFDPNPARLTRPDSYLGDLSTVGERMRYFEHHGVEEIIVVSFNSAFAQTSGYRFLEHILVLFPYLQLVVVGFNFHLGHNRDVRAADLSRWMGERGIRVDIVTALKDNEGSISSSRIRRAVATGDLQSAATMLGRPYTVAVDGGLPSHRSECRQMLPPAGTYRCTFVAEELSREGMMRVAEDGTLTWEPRTEQTHYVILRSTTDVIDS
jgi:riboflavin kinase / FMN adenylyltransferase